MTIEKLAYKMEPAGHEEPPSRRKYQKPDRKLAQAFEEWRKGFNPDFWNHQTLLVAAENQLRDSFSAEEAHALLLSRQENIKKVDGIFLSAVYKRAPEQVIVFDLHMPLDFVGFELSKDKILINFGNISRSAAYSSEGIFVNYGKTGGGFGDHNKGLIINYAPLEKTYAGMTRGPFFNLDTTQKDVTFKTRTCTVFYFLNYLSASVIYSQPGFSPSDIQAFWHYLDVIQSKLEEGRDDYKKVLKVLQELGNDSAKKINNDIEDILKRAGYNVKE